MKSPRYFFASLLILAMVCIAPETLAQTMVLDSSNVVVGYHYSCNTRNAEGNPVKEEYDVAVLIGKKIVAQQGLCEQTLDEDNNDEYVRILTERQHNIPKIYMGWPEEDKITLRETVLMSEYETIEAKTNINWTILPDTLMINGYACRKACANVHGRQWTVWFAEELPMPYGPWLLRGLPGLILQAEADNVHHFTMTMLSAASYPIKYDKRIDIIKASREKYVKYRDKVTKNPLYLSNPSSLVSPDLLRHKNIYQFGNGTEFVEMNGHIFNPHPNAFIPLEAE
jgi:GLPGLI family protein